MRMSKIVRTAANIFYPFILIFGLYVVIHGHLTPGGGFQGGAVVATGTVLVIIAYEYRTVSGLVTKEGMRIRLDWVPGTGTRVSIDGAPADAPIPGEDFYRALLRIWLGPDPVQSDLKRALLGAKD